ncbi:MAG: caspase family protein [Phyllobacteriaceae bacterium]|nr:caspase family protein [Phyllobacteriaceae bacterium]
MSAALTALLGVAPAIAGIAIVEEPRAAGAGSADAVAAVIEKLKALPPLPKGAAMTQGARKALVIGNDAYSSLDKLNKAVGDARAISATLTSLGFTVTTLENVEVDGFDTALSAFYDTLAEGDVAFFFYSGHGIADGDNNFLLPVDMPKLTELERGKLKRNAVDASDIVAEIKGRGVRLAFIVLDACRDDPFALEDGRSAASIGGLARMKPTEGAFVIYSAGIRQKALDRLDPADADPNSIFTRKFSPLLETPGLPLVEIAKRTQIDVKALAATVGHVQTPAYYDQVIGQFYLRPPRPRLFGLTIGIDEYGRKFETRGAVNDSERVARALEALGAQEVVRIFDRDARRAYIDFAWKTLVDKAAPGDTIVFHYAGSSAQFPQKDGGTETDGKDEFLMMSGSSYAELLSGGVTENHPDIVTDDVLTGWMEMAAAKNVNVTLVVDGCHGGGLLDREFANVSFIGGSAEDQSVPEIKIDGRYHGAVSEAFARAIEGEADFNSDGFVTQSEMDALVAAAVETRVGSKQTPQFLPHTSETTAALALFELPADIAARRARIAAIAWPVEQVE